MTEFMALIPPSRLELGDEFARLLSSKTFSSSRRSRQLLEYFVNHLLQGTASRVKEYSVGVDVFGRAASYDPQQDAIARTETWRLRSKLAAYYRGEGRDNPVQIGFRPRSLEPVAEYRPGDQVAPRRPNAARSVERIAVLPFARIGGLDDALQDSLAIELVVQLSQRQRLHVVPPGASLAFDALTSSSEEFASKLGVDLLVEGSVQARGNELRVTTLMRDARTGAHLYSGVHDHDAAQAQSDLAVRIAASLDGALLQRAGEAVGGEAHGAYLELLMRMRFKLKYQPGATAELAESIRFFQAAAETQPASRAIRRALSISVGNFLSLNGAAMPQAVSRLLTQNSHANDDSEMVVETSICAAMVAMFKGDYGVAAETLMRTVDQHPDNAMAHLALGIVLLHTGSLEDALQAMSISQGLDPLSSLTASMSATALFSLRRMDAAREQLALCLALDPANMMGQALQGDIDLVSGRHEAALEKTFAFCRMSNGHPLAMGKLGYIYGLQGERARVQAILNTLLAQADEPGRVAPSIALVYLGLGDPGAALTWMRTAAEQNTLVDIIPSMPFYDALRSDKNFTSLIPGLV